MQFSETWGANIPHSGLSRIAAYYLWRGLAPSTRRNYESPRSHFGLLGPLSNYRPNHRGCFSAKVTWLIEWLCSLDGSVKVKIMKLYLSRLKHQENVGAWSKVVLNAHGPPRGVVVPVVHVVYLVHSDRL